MASSTDWLARVLAPPPLTDTPDLAAWIGTADRFAEAPSFAWAALQGAHADRLGWAFAAGYRAALREMLGEGWGDRVRDLGALCVTEAGGGHPRAIQTRMEGGRLRGTKTFVTFGARASALFVLAREGEVGGRPRLGLYHLERGDGVEVTDGPPFPFVPEVTHGRLEADVAVTADQRLPGDGFADYVRPFRTVEDIHVQGAVLAHLVAQAVRTGAEAAWVEAGVAVLSGLSALATRDPRETGTHRALGGLQAQLGPLLADPPWAAQLPDAPRGRWERDRPLLRVAEKVRAARLDRARLR